MTDLGPFHAAARSMAQAVAALPSGTRWYLDADTDADGVCAAAVASAMLRRVGHRVLVRPSRQKDEAHYREALLEPGVDAWMFLDKGASHAALLAEAGRPCFIVDHHNVVPGIAGGDSPPLDDASGAAGTLQMLNPRLCGLDGSRDASASTTAAALAYAMLGPEALRWGPHALAGAIGDWQHRPGWQGWNDALLAMCRQAGHVTDAMQPRLIGVDLAGAVAGVRPGIPSLALRGDAARWLEALQLDPHAEVEDLTVEERTRLVSALALVHLREGNGRQAVEGLVVPTEQHAALGTSLRHVFRIVDACGRQDKAATGIAFLLGDRSARAEGHALFAHYKQVLAEALSQLATHGTESLLACQHAWTDDPRFTGMVAGIGMMHGVKDASRPLCVTAKRPDGRVQVSTRGREDHVKAGLDLGTAVHEAAVTLGHEGGGHPIAAGAVLPADAVAPFLAALDEILVAQGFLGRGDA